MKRYCLDTGVFIEGWNKYYSMKLCPDYWTILDSLAQEGRVFAPEEVQREICRQDDGLTGWLRGKSHFFKPITTEVQICLREILAVHGRLVDSIRHRSIADPWVIAFAMAENAVVVTKEMPIGSNGRRVKIPDVCHALGVPWMDDFQFADEVGIRFLAQLQ